MKHPKKSLASAIEEGRAGHNPDVGVDKKFTMIKGGANPDTSKAPDGETYESPITVPTDEQLEVINTFTRSPKMANEVAVFDTWSANNAVDRDYDYFSDDTIRGFAALPQPYSPVGKSFMVGHDYSSMPVGRIFAVDTQEADGMLWLKNSVYIPNTPQYKSFLENQDFGIFWAVSVGVTLDASVCDVCDTHMYQFGFCENGHVKGQFYDPKSDEVDSFGWPEPVSSEEKGAQQALGRFEGARDFYELSQVFLGAQYFAGLSEKDPGLATIVKGAGVRPVLLGKDSASGVPLRHVPQELAAAKARFDVTELEDGTLKWTDEHNVVKIYDPSENTVTPLGAAESTEKEQDHGNDESQREPGNDGTADVPHGSGEVERTAGAEPADASDRDPRPAVGQPSAEQLAAKEAEEDMSDERILVAARKAGISGDLLTKAQEVAGEGPLVDGLLSTLKSLHDEAEALRPKAAMGDTYREDLIKEAVGWHAKANHTDEGPVSTSTFEKVLATCGTDLELIKELRDEQKAAAEKRFPSAVRRSTFETNPNAPHVPPVPDAETKSDKGSVVSRIHG